MRDGTGNELISLEHNGSIAILKEANHYGSSRIGTFRPKAETDGTHTLANRTYDLKDHLGNIRATVTDERTKLSNGTYEPTVVSASEYYPFGMESRSHTAGGADANRFGYNGKENDKTLGVQDYGFRLYKPELGRFLSQDPLRKDYPELTTYQFAGNMPIQFIDLDGLEPAYFVFGNGTPKVSLASDRLTHEMPANAVYRHSSAEAQTAALVEGLRDLESTAETVGTGARVTATGSAIVTAAVPNPYTAALTAGAATTAGASDVVAVSAGILEGKPFSAVLKGGLQLLGSKLTGGIGKLLKKSKIETKTVKEATTTLAQTGTDLGKQALEDAAKKELAKKEANSKPKKAAGGSKPSKSTVTPKPAKKKETTIGPKKP